MTKSFKLLFLNFLVMSSLVSLTAYSWMIMWMGLEINLLSIIPVMLEPSNPLSSESSMKYFITQAMASSVIIFSMMMMLTSNNLINSEQAPNMMMNSMFMMKMGAAPLHFWFPTVMEGISWLNCLLMMTWQKLTPLMILMNNNPSFNFNKMFIMMSAFISSMMSINQTNLKKILAYSSINHMGWMLSTLMISLNSLLVYFTSYSIITSLTMLMINKYNMLNITQLMQMNKNNKIMLMINFMSLGGLPPLLGFLPKWLIINKMMEMNMTLMTMILIMSSLILLYVYLQMFFSLISISSMKSKNIFTNSSLMSNSTLIINLSLPMFTMLNLN